MLAVRIPLLENEDIVICAECFDKMPPVIKELYQKRIYPHKDELVAMKEVVLHELNSKSYNTDTINVVTKYLDDKISKAKVKIEDDDSIVQKICPICKKKVTYESTVCSSCGYVFSESFLLSQKEIAEIYNNRVEQYKRNAYYEYDYIVVQNNSDGSTNKEKIAKIIEDHAFQGWRLVTMYSNEIGQDVITVAGAGVNATRCEDILLFERCIKSKE